MVWQGKADEMEERTERWLVANGIRYRRDDQAREQTQLDFYLPDFDVYIEVKRFHTPRIADQMGRAENVIAIQGHQCLWFLESLLNWKLVAAAGSSSGRTAHFDCANGGSNPPPASTCIPDPPHEP